MSQDLPGNKIGILIVDNHPAVREGLALRISRQPDMQVAGEAADVDEAWALIERVEPEIVIIDISLKKGNGLDLVKKIKAEGNSTRCLVWSMFDGLLYAERALRAGAQGYINKEEATDRVIAAIRKVRDGGMYASEQLLEKLDSRAAAKKREPSASTSLVEEFSDRELQVFQLIGQGCDMQRISERMNLSIKTVETYRARIKQKLNLPSRTELVRTAVEWVLYEASPNRDKSL
ncbi:MAG: response regulator transcription factor [Planctomycetia bacterium]|nr:response regulator transcription factor [Planctomycetia bacterium]